MAEPQVSARLAGDGPGRCSPASRLLVPCCGAGLLMLFSVLYATDTTLYMDLLKLLISNPTQHPFLDWEWIPSAVECWRRHVDVYLDNTCYIPLAHGRHNYSPLWLRMTFLPYGSAWVAPVGLGLATLFIASLAILPPQRQTAAVCVTCLATFSSSTVYAIERGNADIIMFLAILAGTACWLGALRLRFLGYAIFVLAGLLKFYPFMLLVLALRERPAVLAGVGAASLAAFAAFVVAFHAELTRIGGNMPNGMYFSGTFAAANLPYGGLVAAGIMTDEGDQYWIRYLPRIWLLTLTLASIVRAARLSRRFTLDAALAAMPGWEAALLLSGAALICGCFFAGQNNDYRAIMILLTLPGLLRLGRAMPDRDGRIAFMATGWAIVLVMWELTLQQAILHATGGKLIFSDHLPIYIAHFIVNEVAWWWVITMLLAVLLGFARASPIGLLLRAVSPWRSPGAPPRRTRGNSGYGSAAGPSMSKKLPRLSTFRPGGMGR